MICQPNPSVTVVQKDDLPNIRIQFKDNLTGAPLDIGNPDWTPKARFRKRKAADTLLDITLTKIDDGRDGWALVDWPADALDDVEVTTYELQPYIDMNGQVLTSTNVVLVRVKEKFAEVV